MNNSQEFISANLFPDPSLPVMKRKFYNEQPKEEITAFGYESKIYNDPKTAIKVEQGKYLIPWKSFKVGELMDRYDVRHLIQDKATFLVKEKAKLESKYDVERYDDDNKKATIPYNYDNNKRIKVTTVTEIEKEIINKYKTPKTMIVPMNMTQLNIIESVSKEIKMTKKEDSNLLEIRIQVKNSNNELYSFLNKRDKLYPFYQFILMKKNHCLVEYSDSDNESDN